jgi:hypothetical protein
LVAAFGDFLPSLAPPQGILPRLSVADTAVHFFDFPWQTES